MSNLKLILQHPMRLKWLPMVLLSVVLLYAVDAIQGGVSWGIRSAGYNASASAACPFCSSVNPTVAEQMKSNDVVAVIKLLELPPPVEDEATTLPKAEFSIAEVLKGDQFVHPGMKIETVLIGSHQVGDKFMVMGVDPPQMAWTTPVRTNPRIVDYYKKIPTLPASGPDRLAFFMQFLEDEEDVLANDAYDEFAIAPYSDVIALKDRMPKDKLIGWIKDEEVLESRKRLYFTMLGVCGTQEDVPMLERMLKEEDREKRPGLDALVACYLRIQGPAGLKLIDKKYLADPEAEYVDVFSVIQALRFHSTETDDISEDRIAQSMRLVLDHPKIADIVIPDLARLKDWSVVDRLAEMFRDPPGESKWVRTPIATYMQACPLDKADQYLDEFREIDADAVKRAELMANFEMFADEGQAEEDVEEEKPAGDGSDGGDGSDKGDTSTKGDASSKGDTSTKGDPSSDSQSSGEGAEGANRGAHDESPAAIVNLRPSASRELGAATGRVSAKKRENHQSSSFVSTSGELSSGQRPEEIARTDVTTSPAVGPSGRSKVQAPYWIVIGAPLLLAATIFGLSWSVLNGWFERLIF